MKVQCSMPGSIEVEITFPVFRKHAMDHSTSYTALYQTTPSTVLHHALTINENMHGVVEITLEQNVGFNSRNAVDYQTGTGEYACSREEFIALAVKHAGALAAAIERISKGK